MIIYETYDGTRCRKFTETEFEAEKEIRAEKGVGFFDLWKVNDGDAVVLGDDPKVSDVRKYALPKE